MENCNHIGKFHCRCTCEKQITRLEELVEKLGKLIKESFDPYYQERCNHGIIYSPMQIRIMQEAEEIFKAWKAGKKS